MTAHDNIEYCQNLDIIVDPMLITWCKGQTFVYHSSITLLILQITTLILLYFTLKIYKR